MACSKTVLQASLLATTIATICVTIALIQQFHHGDDKTTDHVTPTNVTPTAKHNSKATNGEPFPWSDIRLPTSIKPLTYDIRMHPDLKTFKFSGSVEIEFEVVEATDFIVLHVKELKVDQPVVKDVSQQNIQVVKYLENKDYEQAYVRLSSRLGQHKHYRLVLTFQGKLSDSMMGFYRSSYKTAAGEKR